MSVNRSAASAATNARDDGFFSKSRHAALARGWGKTMYDVSSELRSFYDEHVRLGKERRSQLSSSRDACLARLSDGLAKLAADGASKTGPVVDTLSQGSYAMHTLNQQANDDYDIDVGVIFDAASIPESSLDARARVLEGLKRGSGGTFAKNPEARTNAVTAWYAQGYHVDLAVYRRVTPRWSSPYLEHAGASWTKRNPSEVQDWFIRMVEEKQPWVLMGKTTVEPQQLRRVVRFVKAFCRSRASWDLPGGMIVTALVVEVFRSDPDRDDVALYNTLVALRDRLQIGTEVPNPLDGSTLTYKPKFQAQVRRLLQRLSENLPRLRVVSDARCTKAEALAAWGSIFRHSFWGDARDEADVEAVSTLGIAQIGIDVGVAPKVNETVVYPYRDVGPVLPKEVGLRFSIRDPNSLKGTEVTWSVRNAGDEATQADDLHHSSSGPPDEPHWETARYKGSHMMICEVRRRGQLVGRGTRKIRVGSR
jgi:hypothetical protein